jgi:branched-chain amino acid transport system permease protein
MIDALSQAYLPQIEMFAVYTLLIGVMIVRPQGLFGTTARMA